MQSIRGLLIVAVFLGIASGNVWAAPVIGGASLIGFLIVPGFAAQKDDA